MRKQRNQNPKNQEATLRSIESALKRIAGFLGVSAPAADNPSHDGENASIVRAAANFRMRVRPVLLQGVWWREDGGPFLAFLCGSGEPVALLPASSRRYWMYRAGNAKGVVVDEATARGIDPRAYSTYAPFEPGTVGLRQLARFGLRRFWRRDLWFTVFAGAVGGALGLAAPLASGILFDYIVPARQTGQLVWIILLLALAGFTAFVFQVARSYALLRMEGKLDFGLESALWDRLLNLPVAFFREYSAGDLSRRASGMTKIRKAFSESVINTLLASLFSLFSLVLIFMYSAPAGIAVTACVLVMALLLIRYGSALKRPIQEKTMKSGRLEGTLIQLIRGYHKFVVTGSQSVAFALWHKPFLQVKRVEAEIRTKSTALDVAASIFPALSAVAFYAAVYYGNSGLTSGGYLALYAAFCTVMIACAELLSSFSGVLQAIPYYERMRPILECETEVNEHKKYPGTLKGEITLSHVVFRYPDGKGNAVDDLSLTVRAGEMVALVGGSGSGKSTILKLLLGFEQPQSGSICYDGVDLATLDAQQVRAQIGTVIQNAQIMSDSIYKNIAGASNISIEDAWTAAKLVGLDQDIEEMPMGMHTFLNEGGRTLSGGQRQKILLARALVKNPRILFLDEATSALDNTVQAVVTRNLSERKITRVVIAHRLSTIMNADTIYVLENGRVVQQGCHDALVACTGPFREFAMRQSV